MYEERFYRNEIRYSNLHKTVIINEESDLLILTDNSCQKEAEKSLTETRKIIKDYIKIHREFLTSLSPVKCREDAPDIIRHMCISARKAGVGPMAGVAGAVSQYVGKELMKFNREVIIENGGDIFIKTEKLRRIKIFAGDSPLSNKISLIIKPEKTPMGICTSAGTVGHSLSFGKADAVVVLSEDTVLADAVATAAGNLVKSMENIEKTVDYVKSIDGIKGVLIICADKMGIWGDIEIEG